MWMEAIFILQLRMDTIEISVNTVQWGVDGVIGTINAYHVTSGNRQNVNACFVISVKRSCPPCFDDVRGNKTVNVICNFEFLFFSFDMNRLMV